METPKFKKNKRRVNWVCLLLNHNPIQTFVVYYREDSPEMCMYTHSQKTQDSEFYQVSP